jgi:hypothetical protein
MMRRSPGRARASLMFGTRLAIRSNPQSRDLRLARGRSALSPDHQKRAPTLADRLGRVAIGALIRPIPRSHYLAMKC